MADKLTYLENEEDPISSQVREEAISGAGVARVAKVAGTLAILMIARRKMNLTKFFSSEVKAAGQYGTRFSRYELTELVRSKNAPLLSSVQRLASYAGGGGVRRVQEQLLNNVITGAARRIPQSKINVIQSRLSRQLSAGIQRNLSRNRPAFLPSHLGIDRSLQGELLLASGAELISGLGKNIGNVAQRAGHGVRNFYELLAKPLPTGIEQIALAKSIFRREGLRVGTVPHELHEAATKLGRFGTFVRGPIRAIAPDTPIVMPGINLTSGKVGGIYASGNLYKFNQAGRVDEIISGVRGGTGGTAGSRTEFLKAYGHQIDDNATLTQFVTRSILPDKRSVALEHKRIFAENFIQQNGVALAVDRSVPTSGDVLKQLSAQIDSITSVPGGSVGGINNASSFFRAKHADILASYQNAISQMASREASKKSSKILYRLHRTHQRIGVGPQYAATGTGVVQKLWRNILESFESGIVDPVSLRRYKVAPLRYRKAEHMITGEWASGRAGKSYLYRAGSGWKRALMDLIEGTYFKQFEKLTGMGLTVRPNRLTDFINRVIGAQRGSDADFFIRRYIGGHARIGLLGVGAYLTFRTIDYVARQSTGWGVTDVAGKVYTSAREFQQHVIDNLGITDAARRAEELYPGLIKSPASMLARATAPYWMTRLGGKVGGRTGAMYGLALGIATALITWGDITQSPEELHRIYTGEQDIPIRKGRYWIFGKTPFGGGKIMYWRPHWYPLLRSKYKYQGQLWESETEQLAQGSILSPILAPILTGKTWDPYYWEKKHYKDRPYPITGELFEPTMPFGGVLNKTIGSIVKPQRIMHPEYWGTEQSEGSSSRNIVPGSAETLGMPTPDRLGMTPQNLPSSIGWTAGETAYALTEQMGLRGWLIQEMAENITGRPDFLPRGPVAQSARRATGWERAYWDVNIGDPFETTEFVRRVIPHRRRAVEEYNPIPNQMPDWMPGEDYFINFKTGDPYTKVELGEARLPGAGYESLHRLHSGIPGVYDAIDRFLILSDVAPYSDEYRHYRYLAVAMAKKEPFWAEQVKRHIEQRAATQNEFEFLSMQAPEDATGLARTTSEAYRKTIAGITEAAGVLDPLLGVASERSAFGLAKFPIAKFFQYKTPKQAYKDFRLHGSEFTDWGNPIRDFLGPEIKQLQDMAAGFAGDTFIPPEEKERREYEEYFDRLAYVKYKKLAQMARDQNNTQLAKEFEALSRKTMTGVPAYGHPSRIIGSIPKRERAFFGEFSAAEGKDREDILQMVSPQMARIYRAQWAMRDSGDRARNVDQYNTDQENAEYFNNHYLPSEDWAGWNPEVDIRDVQLKTVKNEGMNIHNFDLWESQQRSLERRPGVPYIEDIRATGSSIENLRRLMSGQLQTNGYTNTRMYITNTPAPRDSVNIRIKVKRDRSADVNANIMEAVNA